jgi:hypothetical protein
MKDKYLMVYDGTNWNLANKTDQLEKLYDDKEIMLEEWLETNKDTEMKEKFLRYLNGPDGEEIMHKILRLFVKKGDTNWYDLKIQKSLVKSYIKHRLAKL